MIDGRTTTYRVRTFANNDNEIVQYKPTCSEKRSHAEILETSHAPIQCHWKQQAQKILEQL